jgi:hypothetical protein
MRVKLALLADGANVSREGKLNLLGIFDTIYARDLPTAHPHMHLVLRFEAEAAEAGSVRRVEVQFLSPGGEALFRLPGSVTIQRGAEGTAIGIDHVLALANLAFEHPGTYRFRVLVDGAVVVEVPLRVERITAAH